MRLIITLGSYDVYYNITLIKSQKRSENELSNDNYRMTTSWSFIVLAFVIFFTIVIDYVYAGMCYSCAGICHNERFCNCQMGSCKADFCFIEKRPSLSQTGLYRIVKGCVKRPSRTQLGCDYDHFSSHVQCICSGDFCNEVITLRRRHPTPIIADTFQSNNVLLLQQQSQTSYYAKSYRLNVTCRVCEERRSSSVSLANCDTKICRGEWCYEKLSTGGAGCGFGPPTLPYFYRGPELLWDRGSKVCVTLSRGNGTPQKYCICNTPMCNESPSVALERVTSSFPFSLFGSGSISTIAPSLNHRSRSIATTYQRDYSANVNKVADALPYYECVNCEMTMEQNAFTSNCKSNRCYGHFCTYATQLIYIAQSADSDTTVLELRTIGKGSDASAAQAIIHERQGCMNVSNARQVQLGCTHKWTNNEKEELYCACRGDNCNNDLTTAAASLTTRPIHNNFIYFIISTTLLIHMPFFNQIRV